MKLLNKSILSFIIFYGRLPPCQVLRTFRFLIIFRTSISFVFLKLKVELNCLCLILAALGWFWNVLITANTESWLLLILDASSWSFGIFRSETVMSKIETTRINLGRRWARASSSRLWTQPISHPTVWKGLSPWQKGPILDYA